MAEEDFVLSFTGEELTIYEAYRKYEESENGR